jgi:hypothetical protein
MSLPKVPNPAQVVLELPPGYEGSGDLRPRSAEPTAVRSSNRNNDTPRNMNNNIGLRVASTP